MAYNDPSAPHPVRLGVIVPNANKAQFRTELRALTGTTQFEEIKRILAGDDVLLAMLSLSPDGSTHDASGLNTALTDEEWDFLKTANQALTPATRALVKFSQLQSFNRPTDPEFWEWAASLVPPYFPYEEA